MFCPDKPTIYPEDLPFWTKWKRGQSWEEQVDAVLAGTQIHYLNLKQALLNRKNEKRVFNQRYDLPHWNGNALVVAYEEICKALAREGFTPPKPGVDYDMVIYNGNAGAAGYEKAPCVKTNLENGHIQDKVHGGL